jgi:hypothetical protein
MLLRESTSFRATGQCGLNNTWLDRSQVCRLSPPLRPDLYFPMSAIRRASDPSFFALRLTLRAATFSLDVWCFLLPVGVTLKTQ